MIQLIPLLIATGLGVFWLWMFWDMTNNNNLPRDSKFNWTLAFVFANVFTAVYYYVSVYRNRD